MCLPCQLFSLAHNSCYFNSNVCLKEKNNRYWVIFAIILVVSSTFILQFSQDIEWNRPFWLWLLIQELTCSVMNGLRSAVLVLYFGCPVVCCCHFILVFWKARGDKCNIFTSMTKIEFFSLNSKENNFLLTYLFTLAAENNTIWKNWK